MHATIKIGRTRVSSRREVGAVEGFHQQMARGNMAWRAFKGKVRVHRSYHSSGRRRSGSPHLTQHASNFPLAARTFGNTTSDNLALYGKLKDDPARNMLCTRKVWSQLPSDKQPRSFDWCHKTRKGSKGKRSASTI
jgi:hypothetical protein